MEIFWCYPKSVLRSVLKLISNQIRDLRQSLPATVTDIYLVFAIPVKRGQEYWKAQEISNFAKIEEATMFENIKQFHLLVKDENIQEITSPNA